MKLISILLACLVYASPILADYSSEYKASVVSVLAIDSPDYDYIPNSTKLVLEYDFVANNDWYGRVVLDTQDNPLEEAYIEYTFYNKVNTHIIIGTNDVLNGFYNNGTDVLTSGSGLLPQGVYSYDFINGGFSRIFGAGLELQYNDLSNGVFYTIKHAAGKAQTDSERYLETSVFNGRESDSVSVNNEYGSITSIHINYLDKLELFGAHTEHRFHIVKQYNWTMPTSIPDLLALRPNYTIKINRLGFRARIKDVELTTERYNLSIDSRYDLPRSTGGYTTLQLYRDSIIYTIGRSAAKAEGQAQTSIDTFISASYWGDRYTVGAELHNGQGDSWIINKADYVVGDWTALVLTFTYKL